MIFDSFQNLDKNFVCPTPDPIKDIFLGGHACVCIAFDDKEQTFTIINSWSKEYGDRGTFKMKYDYFLNPYLCSDLFIISIN